MKNKKTSNEEETLVEDTDMLTDEVIDEDVIEKLSEKKIKDVKKVLAECKSEKALLLEEVQRVKADFLNTKKRLGEQMRRDTERLSDQFVEKLLPLADSFEMAMADAKTWESCDASWRTGMEAIYSQLQSILSSYDAKRFGAVGDTFDPTAHEAVSVTDSDLDPDTVVEILQSGYARNDTVIRPAKVILSS